ncbi:hypothetical protein [Hydrogenophaga sp.]|uniref:hypothetical protein n=1 Tax=Hydrogenophaga sp. TaxID=1904254 RepID=UPI0027161572|nr:hypothetical protein [Hydrogenophaga sp.]MDO9438427.1 hypothetical protein [Hydrogenophaga sp.]
MHDLSAALQHSYQEHPAFRFNAPHWELREDALAAFNATYAATRQIGATLSDKSLAVLRRDCQRLMANVFSALKVQCADETEIHFLAELANECERLLNEELDWYARPTMAGLAHLDEDTGRQAAIHMQVERHFFGRLRPEAVDAMRDLASADIARFRTNAAAGQLKRDDLSVSGGATVRAIRAILNREFRALGVLDAVSAYTGRKTQVLGLALELSVPQATWWRNAIDGLDRPARTLYAHMDETISCPKAIVYLTDVNEQNGPTSCYPGAYEAMHLNPLQEMVGRVIGAVGTRPDSPLKQHYAKQYHQSMNSENFRRHFMRLPPVLRFNSHLGWDVMPGSDAEAQLVNAERKLTGLAGTFIAFDGARLLHRGGLMESGERVALQVIFSDVTLTERIVSKAKRIFS